MILREMHNQVDELLSFQSNDVFFNGVVIISNNDASNIDMFFCNVTFNG